MRTEQQREQEFRKELQELLNKHRAEIEAREENGNVIITVMLDSEWTEENEQLQEYAQFELQNCLDYEK